MICEHATYKDPTVFAAASENISSKLVELKAIKQTCPATLMFVVTSAYTHAVEDEFCFFDLPPEDRDQHQDCVWRSIRAVYGRRKGARRWQKLFHGLVTLEITKKAGFIVKVLERSPTLYYIEVADGALELQLITAMARTSRR